MIQTIIFDLSEVLIAGLVGVEQRLASRVGRPEPEILDASCLFIDDSTANVGVARSLGIESIRFTGAPHLAARLVAFDIM